MTLPAQSFREQVVDVLRDLVRIDTSNPPGNEVEAARYLRDLLAPAGIEARIVESAPGRGNLIARLCGNGAGKPLMFMGHLDVVGADPTEWQYPPFAAEIHDGFVWGRGTTDMKGMIAACAVAMLALAETAQPLKRDLLFVATADEEQGGRWGMGWLVQQMPELCDIAGAINEGGGHPIKIGKRIFYTCQSAEKGICRTIWTARANGGHASEPHADIATLKLCRALARLGDGRLGGWATDTMRAAFRLIAAAGDDAEQGVAQVDALLAQGYIEDALRVAGVEEAHLPSYWSLFYDTAAVTVLRAGDPRHLNVIPSTAAAYVDGRLLPGQTREGYLASLRRRITDDSGPRDDIEIEVYQHQFVPGLESSVDTALFRTISQVMAAHVPGSVVIPWACAGSTDAKHLVPRGVPVYGFMPAPLSPPRQEGAGAHANNERIHVESLSFALEVLYDIARRFCSQG